MEKPKKSKPLRSDKQKQIVNSDTLSSHSTLSINPDEPLVNNTAHHLFILAVKRAREERQQEKIRQKNPKLPIKKTKKLTIADLDHLFEEKRLRISTMKNDLYDLYQKSSSRIRSMLDIHQIDQFIQTTEKRKLNSFR
jgi:hypothetical protein